MNLKIGVYMVMAVTLIAGGSLLVAKGKDAVSQAENRKQGTLEAEQKIMLYDKSPGTIVQVNKAMGEAVQKGELLFKVKSAGGTEEDVLAPETGQMSKIVVKPGDQITQGMPVAMIQKSAYYTDLYVQESEIQKLAINQGVKVHFPYLDHPDQVHGVVASVAAAPQFANLRMTRERGQADLSMLLVRISVDASPDLLPGMTAEVNLDDLAD
ncbi:HlyD family efflux transporter periplasmic adaptor subunit [Paenibacillus guangzhouensis]|uniref:HlyD family efflux transporter periplasmic adaptor subunit n=1 Tax=Paenibacillus guangzhouensis TaxID=1473112 RepID=UPI001266FCBD|nr:HlyD family efflux transporter periplasmic adaptor subunit [Paenibacillus guangzhouensis]